MHTDSERFWSKVDKTESCWLWTASVNGWGYGRFVTGGRATRREWMAHRWSYETLVGPLPEGRPTLDHLCRNRRCVRPEHLDPITAKINRLRGLGAPAVNARKVYCKRGHEFTPANTRMKGTWRQCRACDDIRTEAYRDRKAALKRARRRARQAAA